MKEKNQKVLYILVVLAVIGFLVFMTLKNKDESQVNSPNDSSLKEETNDTGVQIAVLQEGTGDTAVLGDKVSMNYTGVLVDGTAFDSNVDPKFNHVEPFIFTLGNGEVIPGWDKGIVGMKVGERRVLQIAPELAYGTNGYPPVIPPNSVLLFQIELVNIIK